MITISDSNKNTVLQNILKSQNVVSSSIGATIEYNINDMVDKINPTYVGTAHSANLTNAFKKLFPIDSIFKPFRPPSPGIKYLIYTDNNTDTPYVDGYEPHRSFQTTSKPRLYYPGPEIVYKYWVAPKNSNINVSLDYLDNQENPQPKPFPCNKVVARFEKNHDTPSSWTIKGTKQDGTEVTLGSGTTLNSNAEATVYYNGTAWSTTEPSSYESSETFKKISLLATNSGTGKLIAVIELSPRWIIDVTSDIESYEISKQTSLDQDSILPVGSLTANSLSMSLNKFKQFNMDILEYNRDSSIDVTKTYLSKNAMIKPYVVIKNDLENIKVNQGLFYMHSWQLGEFGNANILALDSSKILQETLCPLIMVEDAPVTSSIKRLLDSIGFSNYNFNTKIQSETESDNSIPSIKYFWTSEDSTVWETLQELCRDIQMNANVDENNILQFYSRDWIYDSEREPVWTLTSENVEDEDLIPNIVSLTKKEIASANSVKILWSAPSSTQYDGSSSPIWFSDESWLGAGSLTQDLMATNTDGYFSLNNNTLDQNQLAQALGNFNGYVLIDGEIVEFEGIEYQYVPKDATNKKAIPKLIKSKTDIFKWQSLSKAGYSDINNINSAYFKPTGRIKIKQRGAFGTEIKDHKVLSSIIDSTNSVGLRSSLDSDYKVKPGEQNSYYKTPTNWTSSSVSKSFLSVSNLDKDKTMYTIGVKNIDGIDLSKDYYSFGTRMFFDNNFESPEQIGGLAIFTGENGQRGYYITISTTALVKTGKEVRILKRQNGKVTPLADTQTDKITTLAGIYAAQAYNVDVLVKKTLGQTVITVYINGFKIEAKDTEANDIPLVSPSSRIGFLCGQGIVYYDYVYGCNITEDEWKSIRSKSSYYYAGVYSDDSLSLLYGDILYSAGETVAARNKGLIEFGKTAREIRKAKFRYDNSDKGPAIPIKPSTGGNKYVTILDNSLQPFGGEIYALNNTSVFVPLHDNNYSTFWVAGNEISKSGQIEYLTDESSEMAIKQPVQFESSWIQTEQDAKSLADWIKSTSLNKGRLVDLEIFGNPLLSPGDIVKINYPLQQMEIGDDVKYIITDINNVYSGGVSTRLVCRAI